MSGFYVESAALRRLDEITDYTHRTWGEEQAVDYVDGLFAEFAAIAGRSVPWRSSPAELGVSGFRHRYRSHFIYWRVSSNGEIAIMTILHQRMQQALHLDEVAGLYD